MLMFSYQKATLERKMDSKLLFDSRCFAQREHLDFGCFSCRYDQFAIGIFFETLISAVNQRLILRRYGIIMKRTLKR